MSAEAVIDRAIDLDLLLRLTADESSGARVIFCGSVRNHHAGRNVAALEYESFVPLASRLIDDILSEGIRKFGLNLAVARHRVGYLSVGEIAVVVITCAAHRKEAYAANEEIIHRIKHEAPIWKKEHFSDGRIEWSEGCDHTAHQPESVSGSGTSRA